MIAHRVLLIGLIVLTEFGTVATVRAADNVWSVQYFNSRKAEWDQLAGAAIRIEGRVSLLGSGQMRLLKCEVPIHADEALIRSLPVKKPVELTGRLKKENGKFLFEADRIKVVPTDLEEFDSRVARLRNPRASEWYELGDWATERSRFYDDADLNKKSLTAYEKGIDAEWRELTADNADGRFRLARKLVDYKLSESRRLELMHEGDRILCGDFLRAKPVNKDAARKLLGKLAEDLPGSTQASTTFPAELKTRYEHEPLAVYHDSPEEVRRQLHRILYSSVLLKTILDEAAKDGRNGDVIADRLEKEVPEASQLVQQYRSLKLAWRLEQAGTSTRSEIVQLAADFQSQQQPEQARLALTQWLKGREVHLRKDGPLGLLQLAEEYLSLLMDEPKAVALLVEANRSEPTFTDVTEKLKSLGYENTAGVWIKSTGRAPSNPTPKPIVDSFIPGSVVVGMNATAARLAMGGRASSVARIVAKGQISEVWSYGQPGTSRLVIRLETSTGLMELRVTDVSSER